MINENFVFLGMFIQLAGSFIYIKEIIKGKVKPNRMTWLLWAFAPMIAFAAQISEGAGLRSVQAFASGFGPLLIVIVSFATKKAYWRLKRSDYFFGLLSLLGLLLWFMTGEGILAIIFAIAADLFAGIPTIHKIYRHPDTENSAVFGLGIISSIITMLTITSWRFEEYGFSLYILLICIVLFFPTLTVWLKPKQKVKVV